MMTTPTIHSQGPMRRLSASTPVGAVVVSVATLPPWVTTVGLPRNLDVC